LGNWEYTTLVALTRVYDIGFSSFVDTSAGRLQGSLSYLKLDAASVLSPHSFAC
jgi:hypothetical protein